MQLLVKTIRECIAKMLVVKQLPLLNITSGALTQDIETETLANLKQPMADYGMQVLRLGDFSLSLGEEDEASLKGMYKDSAQIRMAGGLQGFQQLAAGKAMMAAGEGMARGDGGGGGGANNPMLAGAGLGMGMAMANMFNQGNQQQQQQQPQPAAPAAAAAPSLEDRLKKLKSLKEAGLLDDQEYAAKRADILKDI